MAPTPNPGPIYDEDYPIGSIGWTENRKADENFIAGCLFGVVGTIAIVAILTGVFYG